ncbi:fimbrial protein [Escherichia coli]|uniref:fimbrial protein n=1 Tax=Escherichia coli TaxID=562 RepID=UPI00191953F7|nr:fimbrial protein [Escherichia coli]EHH5053792.1 fimbrial protein [Escherichia coli]EHW5498432.1 fimbrial protein [Escherichia coli]EII8857075.1 fimbrial protein [Escherichia coli]CAD5542645.1 PixF protein [Escherichia coli]CAD5565160.1 PixF protein [Escherichia coli]
MRLNFIKRAIGWGMLLLSYGVLAMDIPVEITGEIQVPPCQVNNGKIIEVKFGDVSVADVSNQRNRRKVIIPVTCGYAQGTAYVKVTGAPLGSNTNVLMTNINDFGIALYQGDGTTQKLILGEGRGDGNETIGYPIETGISGKEKGTFTFTAVPYKDGNSELKTGGFSAAANISIRYQ